MRFSRLWPLPVRSRSSSSIVKRRGRARGRGRDCGKPREWTLRAWHLIERRRECTVFVLRVSTALSLLHFLSLPLHPRPDECIARARRAFQ